MYDYRDAAWSAADACNHCPTLLRAVDQTQVSGLPLVTLVDLNKSYTAHMGYVFAGTRTGTFMLMGARKFVIKLCKLV